MMTRRLRGIVITGCGVLILSPDAILIRLIGAELATVLFWRSAAMATGLFAYLLLRDRARPATMLATLRHPLGWGLALLFALSNILFVTAVEHAAISDTLGCLATASIFAALFSALFLGERIPPRTWIAASVIAAGLFLIAFGGGGSGFGRLVGVAAAAALGATFVVMRATGEGDTVPGIALGALLIAVVSAPAADPLSLAPRGAAAVAGLALVLPLAFALIGRGPRYLPAPEVSLLMLLETVFGTFWAWLWLAEIPTAATFAAIVIILATLAVFYARQARVARQCPYRHGHELPR